MNMAEAAKKTAAKKTAAKKKSENDGALRAAYGQATSRLRDMHREDFNSLMTEEAKQRNIDWTPRKTQAEKDAEAFDALLAEHPEFKDRLVNTDVVDPALDGSTNPPDDTV